MRLSRLVLAAALVGLAAPVPALADEETHPTADTPDPTETELAGDDATADDDDEPPPPPDVAVPVALPDVAPAPPGQPPATAAQARAAHDPALDTTAPTDWAPAGALSCIRRGRLRGFCNGPRRIPLATTEQDDAARALGVGSDNVGHRLVIQPPEARWVDAAGRVATPPPDLMFPVEAAALWRGYGMTHRTVRGRHRRRITLHHAHMGVDLGAAEGTFVRAANDGLVAYAGNGIRGYGNLVEVVHGDGTVTFYAHMRAAYVVAGLHVRRGQVLGEVGDTGFARGKHLHFEWHVNGAAHNPLPHFAALPPNITPSPIQLDERIVAPDRSVTQHRGRHGRHAPARRNQRAGAHPARPAHPAQ